MIISSLVWNAFRISRYLVGRLERAHLGCTELLLDTSDHEFERKVLGALAEMRGL